ncbi:TPA: hypothetical protein HA295_04575 [Candidatus Woesearchaeota archaeon]|nr:hypothetical protein [Candidatus Woesearchaeota archaeon]
MDNRESILSFIRQNGPILPAKVAKHLGVSLLMGSAHLAEMTATGKLKSTWLKIGGSPLYYIPGQEEQLEKFSDNLNEKERRAYALLKENRVLRDKDLEPLERVSLRNIKDFSFPLTVTYEGGEEIFWRFHSVPGEEAEKAIALYLKPEEKPEEKEAAQEPVQKEEKAATAVERPKRERKQRQATLPAAPVEAASVSAPLPLSPITQQAVLPPSSEFDQSITTYFTKNNIEIVSKAVIKKNADIEYVIHIPSAFGQLEYLCRAKNKRKLSDGDLSTMAVQGQLRKLPVIILSPGELGKKAAEMLPSLKGVTYHRL